MLSFRKQLFLLNAIFDENGSFAFEMIVMTRKWLFCRRVGDILQRLPRLVLSIVAKRRILFWKHNFEKKNLHSHIWWIWFWNNSFKKKGSYLTRTVCISVIACLLFLPYDHDDDNDNDDIYCLSPDNLIRGAGNAFRGNQITRLWPLSIITTMHYGLRAMGAMTLSPKRRRIRK